MNTMLKTVNSKNFLISLYYEILNRQKFKKKNNNKKIKKIK